MCELRARIHLDQEVDMSDTQVVEETKSVEVSEAEELSQDAFDRLFGDKPLVITDSEVRD